MDVASIKLIALIFYLTLLVVIACVWFRLVHAPHGDQYRRIRKQGGYQPLDPHDIDENLVQGILKPNSST